jgi:hypothetical protein
MTTLRDQEGSKVDRHQGVKSGPTVLDIQHLDNSGPPSHRQGIEIVKDLARYTAWNALLTKALVAMFMEQSITDDEIFLDGPVGRALDQAIEVIRPLVRARG